MIFPDLLGCTTRCNRVLVSHSSGLGWFFNDFFRGWTHLAAKHLYLSESMTIVILYILIDCFIYHELLRPAKDPPRSVPTPKQLNS